MESVLTRTATGGAQRSLRLDAGVTAVWALVGAVVLYLSLDGGGYDVVVRSQVGIVAWWIVLVGAIWGVLPVVRPSRTAVAAIGLLTAYLAWLAVATSWSLSVERSLDEVSRLGCYVGILVLAVAVMRDRELALRHTTAAVAAAISIVALLALLSRLHPGLFANAEQTASFLPATQKRLAWPMNYWNALGALLAMGLPLLVSLASSARRLVTRALAAAAIPMMILCGYLTFSRAYAIAGAAALVIVVALPGARVVKLATVLGGAIGGALLVAGASRHTAVEHGYLNAAARHQGTTLLVATFLIGLGVAAAQVAISLVGRHVEPPAWFVPTRRTARVRWIATIAVVAVAGLAAGVPHRLDHAWNQFKKPDAAALHDYSLGRFGSFSGNGRYYYWKVAVNQAPHHLLQGTGPGTFQLVWLPHAPHPSYVQNAHSLYVETLSDAGLVGLLLLVGFFVLVLVAAGRAVARTEFETRVRAAGVLAALVAFLLVAASDWIWQIAALPAVFIVLAAAVLAPGLHRRRLGEDSVEAPAASGRGVIVLRGVAILAALACIAGLAIPLATTTAIRRSEAAASMGNSSQALSDALTAAKIEPGAVSPQLQAALVLEMEGNRQLALRYAEQAVNNEPANWSTWLIVSRLQAENGHAAAALQAYQRAKALNPTSVVFRRA